MLRIKLWRMQQGLTQGEAALKLGLGLSTLALLENGRLRPTAGQRGLLRRTFGVETDSLFEPVQESIGVSQ